MSVTAHPVTITLMVIASKSSEDIIVPPHEIVSHRIILLNPWLATGGDAWQGCGTFETWSLAGRGRRSGVQLNKFAAIYPWIQHQVLFLGYNSPLHKLPSHNRASAVMSPCSDTLCIVNPLSPSCFSRAFCPKYEKSNAHKGRLLHRITIKSWGFYLKTPLQRWFSNPK